MSFPRDQTARLVLERVPENERLQVMRDAINALNEHSSNADLRLSATLLSLQPDADAKATFFAHLEALVRRGEHDQVLDVLDLHPEMRQEALSRIVEEVSRVAAMFEGSAEKSVAVPMPASNDRRVPLSNGSSAPETSDTGMNIDKATNYLRFLVQSSTHLEAQHAEMLLLSCISLLGMKEKALCLLAQDALFCLFGLSVCPAESHSELIWTRVRTLLASANAFYKTLGCSLWLRWIAAAKSVGENILKRPAYWSAVVDGLREGDSERRKVSLQILRASVDVSANDPTLRAVITVHSDSQISFDPSWPALYQCSASVIQKQYERFCTVFETIILGRYLNQVIECETDLDFLSSPESVVKSVWLYTLLNAALGPKMQDSNRKFIGRWAMKSNMRADDFDRYMDFFRHAFLPWLTIGHLFTSSLRIHDGRLRCGHGEKLSQYISRMLQWNVTHASAVIKAILDSIFSRDGNNFAYASVYLVEGISQAIESCDTIHIGSDELEGLGRVATWAGLPEVARDYILVRYRKLCALVTERQNDEALSNRVVASARSWHKMLERVSSLKSGASAHIDGNMASMELDPSKRDMLEQKTIQKCEQLRVELNDTDITALDAQRVENTIDDIWSDLEYLEYPKSLLAVLPRLMPHQRLVQAALAKSGEEDMLRDLLAKKTQELVELAQARSYMLSPLTATVRHVTLENPAAAPLFELEDFVVRLAENPPTPSLDAQLEDAIVPLLQSLDSSLVRLNYEYYFNPREGRGIASLLDLVGRLGTANYSSSKNVLDRLLDRWKTQKVPPATVNPWKTALQLQVMLLCADQCLPRLSDDEGKSLLKDLHYLLAIEPLPRYRYLIEWIIARAYIHRPQLRPAFFEELGTKDHHSNPKFLASLMKLGLAIVRTKTADEDFALQLKAVFVPLAASSKVVIRHEAQWQIPILMDYAREKGWKSIFEDPAFKALDEFIRSLMHFGNPPLERQIDRLDPVRDHNFTHLVEGTWWKLDHVEQPQASHADFLRIYESDKSHTFSLPPACMPIGPPIPPLPKQELQPPTSNNSNSNKILQNITTISRTLNSALGPSNIALQTKGAAYLSTTASRTRHTNLLVVASLIENPYNLGGLSRVSEIFGAGALYLTNPHVTSNKDFTGVSVSSHHHLPILPLPSKDIHGFLRKKKIEEGFKVVGIEQTDRSVLVGEKGCILPEKSILVIGSEREGIPALLLGECDLLVEIPQVGITRSLNVQSAAGIVLCEYAKQHRKK